jgi:aminoglycoside phosphotransferase (APT) family kinase protein
MSSLPGKVTYFVKDSWARWMPPFAVRDSIEGSARLTDLERIVQTGVVDPDVLAKHLRAASLSGSNGAAIQELQVRRVLKYHTDRRCTVEIALRTEDGWHVLIAKIYRKDRSDLFHAMKAIQLAGFGPQDEFSIAQPIAYVSSLHCVVVERVEGARGDEILRDGDERSRAAAAERCAHWLARFHVRGPKAGSASDAHEHLNSKSMLRCAREIAKPGGTLAEKAARLLHRLEDASTELRTVELCPTHGSFSAAQVILAQGRTIAFDWDRYCVADPAHDVGRFLTAVRRLALLQLGSIRALDAVAEVFRKTYLAVGQPGAERNLRFFEATGCFKWAKHIVCHQVPQWRENAETMLDEALGVLDREAA